MLHMVEQPILEMRCAIMLDCNNYEEELVLNASAFNMD